MFQLFFILILFIAGTQSSKKYNPDWNSLDSRPIPTWYDNAKIGIFVHWGVYSVPSMGTEWFWINWKGQKVPKYVDFMNKNYKPGFTYQEFAKDFTAEQFNATEWALLFQNSGAKYVVVTSKHHDGYTLWPSSRAFSWNSVDIGPKKDIIGELASTIRKRTNLTFGLYYSLFEWFNRMYLEDKENNFQNNTYVTEKVWPEIKDIIERFHPEILWSDGDWETVPDYWKSEELIAWLYNESPVRDTVITNDRWGSGTLCKHGDFYTCQDRFNPGVLKTHKWENAFTIDKTSWGHRFDTSLKDYMTSKEIISEIVTTISCNGNVLINVGPTKYGTITPIFEERLRDMGYWLKMNEEAIYSSSYWIAQNDTLTSNVWYTMKQNSNDSKRIFVYAMILDYPYKTNTITLKSLQDKVDSSSKAILLGMPDDYYVKFDKTEAGILFKLPLKNIIDFYGLKLAWTIKIDIPKE